VTAQRDGATPRGGDGDADAEAQAQELLRRFAEYRRTGDRALRNQLIEEHRTLAAQLAHRFSHRGEPTEDLAQVAMLGLLKAVERFDPERGVAFRTFATPTIVGELKRHFRDHTWGVGVRRRVRERHLELREATDRLSQQLGRRPTVTDLARDLRCTDDEVLEALAAGAGYRASCSVGMDEPQGPRLAPYVTSAEPGYESVEVRHLLAGLLATLPARERRIVALRFVQELTQAEIAARVGVSQMQVSRLLQRSFERMRNSGVLVER
jgi:RNA polymerase sigma-B factor